MTYQRKPIEPVPQKIREELRAYRGKLIFGKDPKANAYKGYVEHSWTMGFDENRVLMWSPNEDINRPLNILKQQLPDWEFLVYNAQDENLPFELDWEGWIDAQAFDPNTLSGVTDKYKARNIKFTMNWEKDWTL